MEDFPSASAGALPPPPPPRVTRLEQPLQEPSPKAYEPLQALKASVGHDSRHKHRCGALT
eukprot:scaffold1938_cov399-Prasinococcus_capsulatus_cf.AAC.12